MTQQATNDNDELSTLERAICWAFLECPDIRAHYAAQGVGMDDWCQALGMPPTRSRITYDQLAARYHLSPATIQKIERTALGKIKRKLLTDNQQQ